MQDIFERLGEEALQSDYLSVLFHDISVEYGNKVFASRKDGLSLSKKSYWDLLRYIDILSCSKDPACRNRCFHIISLLYDEHKNDPRFQTITKAALSKLGNFPSIAYIEKRQPNPSNLPFDRDLELSVKEVVQAVPHREDEVFTDTQFELFQLLSSASNFSFAGPTSMGKSYVIKAFVRTVISLQCPSNLIIIVPTRALINQFALDLKTELRDSLAQYNFKVITNSSVTELSHNRRFNYVFVLTPERVLSYLSEAENPPIGFLFVDEAHKIAAINDVRSVTAYSSIEKALQRYPEVKLYFSSPNVANPEVFLRLYNRKSGFYFKTSESPVAQNRFFVDLFAKTVVQYIADQPVKLDGAILEDADFNFLLRYLQDLTPEMSNIVYCNSRGKTIERARGYFRSLPEPTADDSPVISPQVKKAIRQIRAYVHRDYYLANFLEKGVAYHYGHLPQSIRTLVENLYRGGFIRNIFCTSTLLEGVNLPAKNILILTSKKGGAQFTPIDFWNLAGRAGRLGKELSGDIYCIRDEENTWEKTELIEKREEIHLSPTVTERITKNLRRIEKLLLKKDISGTETEKEILQYIANLISIDTMEMHPNYKSPIIQQLIDNNKQQILDYAKLRTKSLTAPLHILNSNETIDLEIQDKVYKAVNANPEAAKLPTTINYDNCLAALRHLASLYEWEITESKLMPSDSALKYVAFLMNRWINGASLHQMIAEEIDYQSESLRDFYLNHEPVGRFDLHQPAHVNELINSLIDDIENKLRYTLEKYFNHYYLVCKACMGEEGAGASISKAFEIGTTTKKGHLGMGLALASQAARTLNGGLTLAPRSPNGARFEFRWPQVSV